MDHFRIIRRALDITRLYRALWVFGALVALTTARGGSPGNGNNIQYNLGRDDFQPRGPLPWPGDWPDFTFPAIPQHIWNILVAVLCGVGFLVILFVILRYVSSTALIRMVNNYETSGERVSVGAGFRLGWSRAAFRSWVAGLLVGLLVFLLVILLLALAAAPLLLWATGDNTAGTVGTVLAIGLGLLVILLLIVLAVAIGLLMEFVYRAIALEGLGVFDGIARGWALLRRRLGDVVVMALILFGFGLAFALLMIPVALLLVLAGLVVGGLPALLAGAITNLFNPDLPRVVAVAVGLPIFLAVLAVPLVILGGLFETFTSSVWTLTYRELVALDAIQPVEV
jgi:hypothetical protein